MGTIRTAAVAVGGAGPSTVDAYTVPAGFHVRLSEVSLTNTGTAAGVVRMVLRRAGVNRDFFWDTVVLSPPGTTFARRTVFEAGDVLRIVVPANVTLNWIVSGTVYAD